MDSKFLRVTLLVSLLFMVTVFFVVLYANGMGPGQKEETAEVTEEVSNEIVMSGQIGNDLYGWMEDESFFDKVPVVEEVEEGAVRLSLIATSVEKDMRVMIADSEGKPVEGQFFKIIVKTKDTSNMGSTEKKTSDQGVTEGDEYKDLDRDGIIYVADLSAGDYQVVLEKQPGFVVPATPLPVKVKARVEYVAIGDISYMIKTEEEIDVRAEDGQYAEDNTAVEGVTEDTFLRESATANVGIDVSRWNEEINWNKVKDAGVKYAIIRAGYRGSQTGALVEDFYFKKNVEGATAAGIPVGLYFFTQATNEVEAVEEASMVIQMCKDYDITYPIFIDTEGAGGDGRADDLDSKTRTAACQAFCRTIRNAGYETGIYGSKNWLTNNIDTSVLTDDIYIWLAEYADATSYNGKYHMWQYTSSGRVLGIEGRVDLNLSYLEPKEKKDVKYGDGKEEESDLKYGSGPEESDSTEENNKETSGTNSDAKTSTTSGKKQQEKTATDQDIKSEDPSKKTDRDGTEESTQD